MRAKPATQGVQSSGWFTQSEICAYAEISARLRRTWQPTRSVGHWHPKPTLLCKPLGSIWAQFSWSVNREFP